MEGPLREVPAYPRGPDRFRYRSAESGYTLFEIIVVLILIAGIAGVLLPQVIGRLSQGEASTLARNLSSISDALQGFRGDVSAYPSTLRDLAEQPSSANNVCGQAIPAQNLQEWRGPYLNRRITAAGLPSGTSTINAALTRQPANASTTPVGELIVTVQGVDREVADRLEAAFDGNAALGAGTVRWTDAGGGRGDLTYRIPIRGC